MESVGLIFIFVGYVLVRIMLGHHNTPTMRDRKQFQPLIAQVGKKQYAEVLPLIESALQKKPESALCWALKAQCHLGLKEYNQAVFYAEKAVNIDHTLYETYYHKALAYYELNDISNALCDLDKAIWYSREQFAAAFYHKGLILLELEEEQKAIDIFEKAIKLGHESANIALLRLQHRVKQKNI